MDTTTIATSRQAILDQAKAEARRHATQPHALAYGHCGNERHRHRRDDAMDHLIDCILHHAWQATPPAPRQPLDAATYARNIDATTLDTAWTIGAWVDDILGISIDDHPDRP